MPVPLLASTGANAEASQIIGTLNGVIQNINSLTLIGSTAPTSLRNAVIGGDFGTNPWQRTTSFTSIAGTATYTADRFFAVGGASSSIAVSRQTGTPVSGFAAHARVGRSEANANTAPIYFGQVLTSAASTRFQGLPFVLSFWARKGAGFSDANSALSVVVATGTGSDETTQNFASLTWTNYTAATLYGSSGNATSQIGITSAFARYALAGAVPLTATQIGFKIGYTPVGTAASDYFEIAGVQLEQMPQGGIQPTPFEWRPSPMERTLCQHYYYKVSEPNASTRLYMGQANSTTVASLLVPFPTPMRIGTTTSITGTTVVLGSFAMTGVTGGATQTLSSLAVAAGSATTESLNLTATLGGAGFTAGNATYLLGGAGAGSIAIDAEL